VSDDEPLGHDRMSMISNVAADVFGTSASLVVEREPEGVSTVVYRITRGTGQFFLRLAEHEDDNLEVDALVHERLAMLGVRTPAIVYVTPHDPRLGRSLMITEHIGGRPLTDTADLSARVAVIERAAEDIAAINTVFVDGFGWVVRDRPVWPPRAELDDYAAYVVDDLPDPWPGPFAELFPRGDLELIEEVIDDERHRVVDRAVLVHGDLGLDHIFESSGAYSGIIDFGELRGAEPEFDLAVFFNHSPREGRAELIDALLRGYQRVTPLPDDIRHRMRVSGMFKALRQLCRWLQPGFPHERDPAALAALVSRRFVPALRHGRGRVG
jgi:aminoglycoside phosphotransferase (APT) family kinase protein